MEPEKLPNAMKRLPHFIIFSHNFVHLFPFLLLIFHLFLTEILFRFIQFVILSRTLCACLCRLQFSRFALFSVSFKISELEIREITKCMA
jgi:hypothetical protein